MDEPLMRVEDISLLLNISEQTIRRYIRNKELNAIKFKRSYRITREDLNRFIKERYERWVIKKKYNLSIIYYIYEYKIKLKEVINNERTLYSKCYSQS